MRTKKIKNKLKNFFENKAFDENVLRKIIQEQQKEISNLQKSIRDIDNTLKSMTTSVVKTKKRTREIGTILATSRSIKEIRERIN